MKLPARPSSSFITSYDLIKTFAVVTMIADHIGIYFYPDDLWWRAVGRLSAPVWIFLIGFARSRDLDWRLWAGCLILVLATFIFGGSIFPLNILLLFIVIRVCLDKLAYYIFAERERLWIGGFALFLLLVPTMILVDYGSLGFIIALFGFMMRVQLEGRRVRPEPLTEPYFAVFAFCSCIFATLLVGLNVVQQSFVISGCALVFLALYHFRPVEYPVLTQKFPKSVSGFLRFCGRWTLEIYVVHLVIFKFAAMQLGTKGFGLFDFTLLG